MASFRATDTHQDKQTTVPWPSCPEYSPMRFDALRRRVIIIVHVQITMRGRQHHEKTLTGVALGLALRLHTLLPPQLTSGLIIFARLLCCVLEQHLCDVRGHALTDKLGLIDICEAGH